MRRALLIILALDILYFSVFLDGSVPKRSGPAGNMYQIQIPGIFSSAITKNQIVSFIVAVFLCFFCYVGFESISSLDVFSGIDHLIVKLGINEHYVSMSRGVIDTRDVLYFLTTIFLFLLLTKTVLGSRKW